MTSNNNNKKRLLEFPMGCGASPVTNHGGHTAANQVKGAPTLKPQPQGALSLAGFPGEQKLRRACDSCGAESSLGRCLFHPSTSSTHHEITQTARQVERDFKHKVYARHKSFHFRHELIDYPELYPF